MQHLHESSDKRERSFNLGWRAITFAVAIIALSLVLSIALSQFVASALLS